MTEAEIRQYLDLIPAVRETPGQSVWISYDAEADVLYVNFRMPSRATDSEINDDDIITRYDGDDIVGVTVLHASRRQAP